MVAKAEHNLSFGKVHFLPGPYRTNRNLSGSQSTTTLKERLRKICSISQRPVRFFSVAFMRLPTPQHLLSNRCEWEYTEYTDRPRLARLPFTPAQLDYEAPWGIHALSSKSPAVTWLPGASKTPSSSSHKATQSSTKQHSFKLQTRASKISRPRYRPETTRHRFSFKYDGVNAECAMSRGWTLSSFLRSTCVAETPKPRSQRNFSLARAFLR